VTNQTRWLDDRESLTWLKLAAVIELLPAALDAQLTRDSGLTFFDYFTLAQLAGEPDRCMRVTELAAQTNASVPRLSRVVTRLEMAGLVRRRTSTDDGRGRVVCLTDAGVTKLSEAAPGHIATIRRLVLDVLTPAQLDRMGLACDLLLTTLDPDGRMFGTTVSGAYGRPGLGRDPAEVVADPA
jgi:DNA-binding MarR family transcriptional regulator